MKGEIPAQLHYLLSLLQLTSIVTAVPTVINFQRHLMAITCAYFTDYPDVPLYYFPTNKHVCLCVTTFANLMIWFTCATERFINYACQHSSAHYALHECAQLRDGQTDQLPHSLRILFNGKNWLWKRPVLQYRSRSPDSSAAVAGRLVDGCDMVSSMTTTGGALMG